MAEMVNEDPKATLGNPVRLEHSAGTAESVFQVHQDPPEPWLKEKRCMNKPENEFCSWHKTLPSRSLALLVRPDGMEPLENRAYPE